MIKKQIRVKVKPGCSREGVVTAEDGSFLVSVNAPAHEGKANLAVIKLLSEYFDIPKTQVIIVRGIKSKFKLIELPGK